METLTVIKKLVGAQKHDFFKISIFVLFPSFFLKNVPPNVRDFTLNRVYRMLKKKSLKDIDLFVPEINISKDSTVSRLRY